MHYSPREHTHESFNGKELINPNLDIDNVEFEKLLIEKID